MGRIEKSRGIGGKEKTARLQEQILQERLAAFREKFGRDRRPGEPVFFDPDADEPVPNNEEKMMNDVLMVLRRLTYRPSTPMPTRRPAICW